MKSWEFTEVDGHKYLCPKDHQNKCNTTKCPVWVRTASLVVFKDGLKFVGRINNSILKKELEDIELIKVGMCGLISVSLEGLY